MLRCSVFFAAVLLLVTGGCDNRVIEPDDPLRLRGSFYAIRVVDLTSTPATTGDTLYAALQGSDATEQAGIRVDGRLMSAVAVGGGAIYYATADAAVTPSKAFGVEVVTPWRTVSNTLVTPAAMPDLEEPRQDVVYPRSEPVPISWSVADEDTATLYWEIQIGSRTQQGSADWSSGSTEIPADVWVALLDSVGVLRASRVSSKYGQGLRDGFRMTAELSTVRTVRVTPFVTPDG